MVTQIDHIGIAVSDIEQSMQLYKKIFGVQSYHREIVEEQGVDVASFLIANVRIELTAATRPDSAIAKFIEKRGEGIHHVAFRSDDVSGELVRLSAEGMQLINNDAVKGAHDMLIAFLHPKSTGGVLMELCQPSS